jgi:hypothetical protein
VVGGDVNRASNMLAAFGTLALLAAIIVPVLMWPDEYTPYPHVARLQAWTAGGILLIVATGCWVGSIMARRRH